MQHKAFSYPSLEDNVLTLTGERKVENEETKNEFRRIERSYCRFTLPNELESDKVEAKYGDRVLTVTIPKAEKTKPRKIEIS